MRLVTINTWGVPKHDLIGRMRKLTTGLKEYAPDIACLQEVAFPHVQGHIRNALSEDFHIVSSRHSQLRWPYVAYLPLVLLTLAFLTNALQLRWWLVLVVCCHPFVIQKTVECVVKGSFDHMGLTTLVHRSTCQSVQHIHTEAFVSDIRGYGLKWMNPFLWWFSMTFLRPGFMIVKTIGIEDALVVNVHLAPEDDARHIRYVQVQRVNECVRRASFQHKCTNVIIVGDLNDNKYSNTYRRLRLEADDNGSLIDAAPHVGATFAEESIDHIFVSQKFHLRNSERIFDGAATPIISDHFGLLVDIHAN